MALTRLHDSDPGGWLPPVESAQPPRLGYGAPGEVAMALDGIRRVLAEEPADIWADHEVCEAATALVQLVENKLTKTAAPCPLPATTPEGIAVERRRLAMEITAGRHPGEAVIEDHRRRARAAGLLGGESREQTNHE